MYLPEGGKTVIRKYEYGCDLDMTGGRKLEQRRLSFAPDTLIHVTGNTKKGHLGISKSDASKGATGLALQILAWGGTGPPHRGGGTQQSDGGGNSA